MRKTLVIFAICAAPAFAGPLDSALPNAQERGAATFRFAGLPLYDARLLTQGGQALDWSQDFALELTYRRNLTQYDLTQGTLRELARMGSVLPIEAKLNACFKDVKKGDRFLAITQGANKVRFWLNARATCTLSHPNITKRFMSIFLGPNSRSASFSTRLRGG